MTSDLEKRLAGLSPEKRALLLKKMKQVAAKKSKVTKHTIPQRTGDGPWPASMDQTALWFFHQLDPDTYAYNNGTGLRIKGPVQLPVLTRAANELMRRHEALRTTFTYIDNELYQKIEPEVEISLPVDDLRHLPPDEAEAQAFALIPEKLREPFDLEKGPLVYLPLLRITDEDYIMVVIMHHAVTDWWSFKLFVQELLTVYQAYLNGQPSPLPELPIQFIDYTLWRNEWLKSAEFEAQMDYWRKQLGDAPLVLDLPTDRPRPAQQDFRGKRHYRFLPPKALEGIRRINAANKASSLMTCMAASFAFLHRLAGVDDLLIGTPTTDREARELENMMGYLLNVLVIRARFEPGMTFSQLVNQLKRTILDGLANKALPFRMLAEELNPERELSRMPIYQVDYNHVSDDGPVFEQHQRQEYGMRLPGYELDSVNYDRGISDVDLQINYIEGLDNIKLILEWAIALFDEETIEYFGDLLSNLIIGMTTNPDTPIDQIDWMTPQQRTDLLETWNNTTVDFPHETALADQFAAQAARTPGAVAVLQGSDSITYADLADRAWRLGNYLVEQGVFDNGPVGLCLETGIDWVTSMLGILAAGGHYVPIDPDYPHERIAHMLEDTGLTNLITNAELIEKLPAMELNFINTIVLDEEQDTLADMDAAMPEVNRPAESLAYTIYTSGSTGRPKGVLVPQTAVLRLAHNQNYCVVAPGDGVGQASNISFDAHVFEVWTTLLNGGRICTIDKDTYLNADQLQQQIEEQGIASMFITTALFNSHMMTKPDAFKQMKYLMVGGDRVDVAAMRRCLEAGPPQHLRNVYGPTESTTFATWQAVTEIAEDAHTIPIGRGIGNAKVYVVDPSGALAAPCVVGQLCLGGPGLAMGYLNAPGLTATRFVPNPFADDSASGSRLYRTGDMVKWLRSGVIEFVGRRDHQVKVRGFRIELGEIENALTSHESIGEAVVMVRDQEGGGKRIVAYVQPQDGSETTSIDQQAVRDFLFGKLPEYMLPAIIVALESFPLTRNGKVDRRALPEPELVVEVKTFEAPRSETEQKLADIWCSVLGAKQVGIRDNFFDLGGDSILGIQVIAGANRMGLDLSTKDLFQYQTIAELAEHVGTGRQVVAEQGIVTGVVPITPIQQWFLERKEHPDHFNIGLNLKAGRELDMDIVARVFEQLVLQHDALRMRYHKDDKGVWHQENLGEEGNHVIVESVDLSDQADPVSAFTAMAEEMHASLSLSNGPLVRATYTDLGADLGKRLLILVHHIIFDGISTRILLEDMEMLYLAHEKGEEARLMPKSSSWKYWCERLVEHASAEITLAELPWWEAESKRASAEIPVDFPDAPNTDATTKNIVTKLTPAQTQALLKDLPSVYNTRINDVLLTALTMATGQDTDVWTVRIALEGHGREELFDDIDFSRTMGWFTAMYPIVLALDEAERTPGAALKSIKEQLRAIPRNGVGYGLMKHVNPETSERLQMKHPQLNFNYLGQFDASSNQSTLFSFGTENIGHEHAPADERGYHFEIVGAVMEGQLSIAWNYSGALFKEEHIQRLADKNHAALVQILEHCMSDEAGGRTPSDYPYVSLNQTQVDDLHKRFPNLQTIYPAVPLQAGMLFHTFMEPDSVTYREQMDLGLPGDLNLDVYKRCWLEIFRRHEALRAVFVPHETGYLQVVLDSFEPEWRVVAVDSLEDVERIKEEELTARAELDKKPFQRLALIKFGDVYRMIWTNHHVQTEGWTLGVLMGEMTQMYGAGLQGIDAGLPPAVPYESYIRWLHEADADAAREYWRNQLAGFEEPTLLSVLPEPEGREDVRHIKVEHCLTREQTASLEAFARQHGLTMGTLVSGAWGLLLSRYTGRADVAFGVTGSGRPPAIPDVDKLVGLFINTLPLRVQVRPGVSVKDWLTHLQDVQVTGRDYEYSLLPEVQRYSDVDGGHAMFDTMMVYENYPMDENAASSFGGVGHLSMFEQTNYAVTFMSGPGEKMEMRFRFDADRFPADMPQIIVRHVAAVLVNLGQNPDRDITQVGIFNDEERQRLDAFAGTVSDYPRDAAIHQLLAAQADASGDAPALTHPRGVMSYTQLHARSNRLAHHLRAQGVKPGDHIGLCVAEDHPDLIAGMVGILKAGAAYVPLDISLPEERLRYIIDDAGVSALVTQSGRLTLDHGIATVVLVDADLPAGVPDTDLALPTHPLQPAYIMYTSGSTGRPKGVVVPHRAVVRLVRETNYVSLGPDKVVLQGSVPSFDASTFEIWGALLNGARLVMMNATDVERIPEVVASEGVTTAWLTSQLFNLLVDSGQDQLGGMQELLVGGDVVSVPHMQQFKKTHPGVTLINGYGPTENTTFTCCFNLSTHGEASTPIGKPIANTQVHLLDENLNRVPQGMTGELFIGGDGLSLGYLGSPAMTAERFVPNPLATSDQAGSRLYRSGDLARFRSDGVVDFLGRGDNQVKIRGFRIELGEIEHALRAVDGVQDAVVRAHLMASGDKRLVAWVQQDVAEEARGEATQALKEALGERLPDYMVPVGYVFMDQFPLRASGKVNFKALPDPEKELSAQAYVAPRNEVETVICQVWAELLELDRVGIHDNFFDLGAHSLLVTRAVSMLRVELGMDIPIKTIFETPTAEQLGRYIDVIKWSRPDEEGETLDDDEEEGEI